LELKKPIFNTYVLIDGWKQHELKRRADDHVTTVERMYQLAVDEETEEIERGKAKRDKLLNSGILWLGVLSVAGTIAGVLQFIDYDNEELNYAARIAAIAATTGVAVGAFLYLQFVGRKRK